ncbi:hypothetical protein RJ639_004322 [Escallonia herrerae]|uniref:Uncharacterized protein n=1 Tax=Escallonia herrerae TaxID=1293975 RepID=A0AA88W530_9ASTE|nr:hypothetical protein RJ639_004322 [Escallonia herrerae]
MFGTLAYEMEVSVPASVAWRIYGSLRLISITVPEFFREIDVIEGDGGPGTFLRVFFLPDCANCLAQVALGQLQLKPYCAPARDGFEDLVSSSSDHEQVCLLKIGAD